jgi:hypothetical protein
VSVRTALILLAGVVVLLVAALVAVAAGYLARRDRATTAQALTRAATAFAATLTLAAVLATTMHALTH